MNYEREHMPDPTIDIQSQVTLPNSGSNVFVQLRESRPERVFYRINLRDSQSNITHVVPPHTYAIPVRHDLGRGADGLRGHQMACVGVVGFVVAGRWQLKCEILVDNVVVETCGPGELNGTQGDMSRFRFICDFV